MRPTKLPTIFGVIRVSDPVYPAIMSNQIPKPTVLVVEDEDSLRRVLIHRLTAAGYDVIAARNGLEAINWLNDPLHYPQIALLDILMPILSGLDVLYKIRALPRKLPIIMMSHADEPIARQAVAEGQPDAFLAKPFSMEELLVLIQQLLTPTPAKNA